jgi:hypothetical protein
MKRFLPAALFFAATQVLAHPGHGKPGFLHFHEFSDGLLIGIGLVAVGLLYWAWKK